MPENILVCAAWPYANGSIHLGHVAGCYLPADIFARYHRLKGNNVLMVSGSDAHGTPVTITAEANGSTPEEVASSYQEEFLQDWKDLGISFDLFTSTHTDNHFSVSQDIFLKLYEKDFIYKDTMSQPYCEDHQRFLADRYVEGICPHCDSEGARGDQCDACGNTLDPKDLINIRHRDCTYTPVFKDTEHFFLRLSVFEKQLLDWTRKQDHWKPNVKNFTVGFLEGGLKDRAITRDITWGVPVPIPGYESKRIYVWFEAVIGYLSASIEAGDQFGNPNLWIDFWKGNSRSFYFMGKDNIPFHTVIWPAMLLAYEGYNLPYDVPANEYVNMESQKISTSRNWVINLKDAVQRYDPDPIRYTLSAIMPETSDSNFTWEEFVRRNNDELVATFGNLVNRVLSMIHRNFDGQVPKRGNIGNSEIKLNKLAETTLISVSESIESCKFREGLAHCMSLAREVNRYLDEKAPWTAIKSDIDSASTTLNISVNIINCLKTVLHPYLPFSTQALQEMLGLAGEVEKNDWSWNPQEVPDDHKLGEVKRLFDKLEDSIAEAELSRLSSES
ncbi:MAG: methionine--tRNA ligase [Chloroflexi bacterium]|nr:methionine--tRNA ligase [Chloroflexota bacterium]|tara:strand:- start:283 stop:1956 length:1674 start_codon:yes stop_codon:yes gene_type:complete